MWVLFYYSGLKVSVATLNILKKEKCAIETNNAVFPFQLSLLFLIDPYPNTLKYGFPVELEYSICLGGGHELLVRVTLCTMRFGHKFSTAIR